MIILKKKKTYRTQTVFMRQKRDQAHRDVKKISQVTHSTWKWKGQKSNPMCGIKSRLLKTMSYLAGYDQYDTACLTEI